MQILETYKRLYKETGREQPMLKPARYVLSRTFLHFLRSPDASSRSFISVQEVMACGEMEMHHATIGARILAELCALPAVPSASTKIPGVAKVDMSQPYADAHPTPARLADMSKSDPLDANWDGRVASTEIDYLADNGAALERAIEADPVTKQRLYDALEVFKVGELSSKAVIEKAIEELKVGA
jgi:transaldolase